MKPTTLHVTYKKNVKTPTIYHFTLVIVTVIKKAKNIIDDDK